MSFNDEMKRINRRVGQMVEKGDREVAKKYAGALVKMRAILAKQYEMYEQGGKLTLSEALKHDRLGKMMREMDFLMRTHYRELDKTVSTVLAETYLSGYYLTAWAVETEVKAVLGYAAVKPETLTAMIRNPVAGLTLNSRLELQRAHVISQIQKQVTQGLTNNETYSTMAKRLKNELENDVVKATRIVRTEGHRVQESAKHDAAAHATNNGVIMMKQWNSLEDVRVRRKTANHANLNNEKRMMEENFFDGLGEGPAPGQLGAAGSDINCRCFLTYNIERVERADAGTAEQSTFDKWKAERDIV